MRPTLAVLALLALSIPAMAATPHEGLYGQICYDPSQGHQGGMRVEVTGEASAPVVVFQMCEGGCIRFQTLTASLTGDRLAFETEYFLENSQGDRIGRRAKFKGRFRGSTLTLEGRGEGFDVRPERLQKNQACRHGLLASQPFYR